MTAVCRLPDKILHHLQISAHKIPVKFFCKSFQIDIHGIDIRQDLVQDLLRGHTVGNKNGLHSLLVKKLCRIKDKFPSHKGLIIGEGNPQISPVPQAQRDVTQVPGTVKSRIEQAFMTSFIIGDGGLPGPASACTFPRGSDLIVLAEGASQTASIAAHRQDRPPRIKARQGLFFNRIQGKGRQPAVIGGNDPPVLVSARAAGSCLTFLQEAVMTADSTFLFHLDPPFSAFGNCLRVVILTGKML